MKCDKCNAPLSGSMIGSSKSVHEGRSEINNLNLKKTVSEQQVFGSAKGVVTHANDSHVLNCRQCGYPIGHGMNVCPNCGTLVQDKSGNSPSAQKSNISPQSPTCSKCGATLAIGMKYCPGCGAPQRYGTVNPWTSPQSGTFCTLKPLAWENEHIDHQPLSFSGTVISLNRDNTDPNNQTITSKEQAELTFENGSWCISDKSAQKTTYIHVERKTKLEKGDIILLGNRRFEFND